VAQMFVQAQLRDLYSPDVASLEAYRPHEPFGILVMAMVGPLGGEGKESFDFTLCTPEWFAANLAEDLTPGRHYLFTRRYDYH
jgi:hypothetical protein